MNENVFLISGRPGSGKTTVVRRIVEALAVRAGGFYTQETRGTDGRRTGFEIVTLQGTRAPLAGVHIRSPYRVGKYGVNLRGIDEVAVPAIHDAVKDCDLILIDEIGRMELYSQDFRDAVTDAIESGKPVLGTIMLAAHPWADAVRSRADVHVFPIDPSSRDSVARLVLDRLRPLFH
ncbi:MAG: NTPase [Dehalococcoidia bacterium]|nr:NTPase [Dehalococcoidia bacterium]